jgi:hypothetical protein
MIHILCGSFKGEYAGQYVVCDKNRSLWKGQAVGGGRGVRIWDRQSQTDRVVSTICETYVRKIGR